MDLADYVGKTIDCRILRIDEARRTILVSRRQLIGANEDPDIFEYAFDSARIIPKGANRQYYTNPRVDALIAKAGAEPDQNARKEDYAEIQQILAEDLPYINLWYFDNVMVYSKRVRGLNLNPSGNYDFLRTAELENR